MYLSLQVAGLVFAVLGAALIIFRWSVARGCLRAANRAFGSSFALEGRDASHGRTVVLTVAAALIFASIAILYGLF
jgi:hypothetical protein